MNKIFVSFDRSALPPQLFFRPQSDRVEQFHNIAFGLLKVAFGKTVRMEFTAGGRFQYTEQRYSAVARIAAIAFFVLAFPFTVPLALAGGIALNWSNSFHNAYQDYQDYVRENQLQAEAPLPTPTQAGTLAPTPAQGLRRAETSSRDKRSLSMNRGAAPLPPAKPILGELRLSGAPDVVSPPPPPSAQPPVPESPNARTVQEIVNLARTLRAPTQSAADFLKVPEKQANAVHPMIQP